MAVWGHWGVAAHLQHTLYCRAPLPFLSAKDESMKQTTYVALLRGINVGGHTVTMERLRELFRELGYAGVRTYIQTGNVFFESSEQDVQILRSAIERHLRAALGYEVPTCLRTVEE